MLCYNLFRQFYDKSEGFYNMKKIIAPTLVLCLCLTLSACKSFDAHKADKLILAIGDVSLESETDIDFAQAFYDMLDEEEKSEVENYNILLDAHNQLEFSKTEHQKDIATDYMNKGEYFKASAILDNIKDAENYDMLAIQCAHGIIPQFIKENGEEQEPGKYFLYLKNEENIQISVWYIIEENAVSFIYYNTEDDKRDGMVIDYTIDDDSMYFERYRSDTIGAIISEQSGYVIVDKYQGTYTGDTEEKSENPLVIKGLETESFVSRSSRLTREYQVGTMNNINEILDTFYNSLVEVGYKGTLYDIGFISYLA